MRRQRRLKNEINVVPYIDVMLVLLVIFMVTAPTIQLGGIDLPSAGEAATPRTAPNPVYVKILRDGRIQVHEASGKERTVSLKELPAEVAGFRAGDDKRMVTIAADRHVQYDKVIEALAALNKAGIGNVGLEVQAGASGR